MSLSEHVGPVHLRADEMAARLRCSLRTVREKTKVGEIPCLRVGDLTLYPLAAIEEWERAQALANLRQPEAPPPAEPARRSRRRGRTVQPVPVPVPRPEPAGARVRPVRPDAGGAA
ncbi:MAG: helix-turn-helix domain-containing protein [Acidimicrobiia bacterium]|nr:helix-turn-helix domain-containing protein [Acidimicrobiia bacterium]